MSPEATRKQPKATKKELEVQVAQLTAALQRERADAENVRRRAMIDRDRDRQLVRRDTIAQLLPVIDNLQLAFSQPPAELAKNQWVAGVLMIDPQLRRALIELGLLPIATVGQPVRPEPDGSGRDCLDQRPAGANCSRRSCPGLSLGR